MRQPDKGTAELDRRLVEPPFQSCRDLLFQPPEHERIERVTGSTRIQPNLVEHLTAFIAVVETGGFSAAARALKRAVSSISYSIVQLEQHCGFELLERGTKRSELTQRGRVLLREAKTVVEGARRFSSHATSLQSSSETRIRIAVDVVFPLPALHVALRSFAAKYPHVRLQFFTSSLNSLWEELRGSRFDFSFSPVAALPLDIEARSFLQIKLSPVAAAGHPLALLQRPLSLSDFQRERQIYFVGSPDVDLERVGRVFGLDVWTANDLELLRHMLRNGLGWAFGTKILFNDELRAGTVRMLRCDDSRLHPTWTIGAVWPTDRRPGPLAGELIRLVAEQLDNDRDSSCHDLRGEMCSGDPSSF